MAKKQRLNDMAKTTQKGGKGGKKDGGKGSHGTIGVSERPARPPKKK